MQKHVILRIAEDVLGPPQPPPQPILFIGTVLEGLEHMFVRLGGGADGTLRPDTATINCGRSRARQTPAYPAAPSDDHTSSFVRTRSITASVNCVVPACPPRSGVFTPDPTVSRTAS